VKNEKKCCKESRRSGIANKQFLKKRKVSCIGHTLRRHCLPKHVTEIKTEETRISARRKKT